MTEIITTWLWDNKIELIGALLGLLYIFFSIKQHIFTWPTGLLTSLLYIVVFFQSGFYADMGLQVYYVVISVYGWYFWLKGGKDSSADSKAKLPVRKIPWKLKLNLLLATVVIYTGILYILINYTNSTVPYMDSLTTALSITATWMLAKKYIEHWLIWIFVDLFSAGLYIYKELWPTMILFFVYTVMAVLGYMEWKKDLTEKN